MFFLNMMNCMLWGYTLVPDAALFVILWNEALIQLLTNMVEPLGNDYTDPDLLSYAIAMIRWLRCKHVAAVHQSFADPREDEDVDPDRPWIPLDLDDSYEYDSETFDAHGMSKRPPPIKEQKVEEYNPLRHPILGDEVI